MGFGIILDLQLVIRNFLQSSVCYDSYSLPQQVDLHTLKVLTGIATQGAISKETQKAYYVTTFKLEVSTNGEDWMVYRHGKNHKVGSESCTSAYNTAVRSDCKACRVNRKCLDALR